MTFRSTFSQIIWLQVVAIVATSLLMPLGIFLFLNHTVADYQTRMLHRHEQVLVQSLSPAAAGSGLSLPPEVAAPYVAETGGFAFSVLDDQGRVLLSSKTPASALGPLPARGAILLFRQREGSQSFFGASFPEHLAGRPLWVQVSQNLENPDVVMDDVLARFIPLVGAMTGGLILVLLTANLFIVRRALKPILRASELAGAISPSRPDVRLPLTAMPREIQPLVEAVNQAFDRLEAGFRAQRDLTADVAHELKTPLAVLRLRIEAQSVSADSQRLLADIDAMSRTVSQLLAVAELENVVIAPTDRADLHQAAFDVTQFLAPLAIKANRAIALTGAPEAVWVHGQQDFLFQAVRNLVENAITHTTAGSRVTVEVADNGRLRVLDRGPGVPAALKASLFQRFWRRRRGRVRTVGGAGLGLAIVARIVHGYGGSIDVENRPGGGAVFELRLPLAG